MLSRRCAFTGGTPMEMLQTVRHFGIGEDFGGGFRPDVGAWVGVPCVGPFLDGVDEMVNAVET